MVTAADSKESAVRAISMGAQAYMLKPFDIDELQRVADYWFRPLKRVPSESPGGANTPVQSDEEEHGQEMTGRVE
jgi:DNA-binding response OmpR family regulator